MSESPSNAPTADQITLVRVAINLPLRRLFDYRIADDYPIAPAAGMRVEVPFANGRKIGLIHSVETVALTSLSVAPEKLKPIVRILDSSPLLGPALIKLAHWMQKYYHAPYGEIWQTLLPAALLKGQPAQLVRTSRWCITEKGKTVLLENQIPVNAVKQRQVLRRLFDFSDGIAHDRLKDFGFTLSHLKPLAGKGWIERVYPKNNLQAASEGDQQLLNVSALDQIIEPNAEQRHAIDSISAALGHYAGFLLFGVTASGKTEVYLRLIQKVLEQGKQALVLVPEIGLTPQTLSRFQSRFNVEIALLHSGMSEQQRLQGWLKARSGQARIVIGTRSALFTPLKNPGIIIVDEEHDRSFRQQQGFRYSSRDSALMRAQIEAIPVVLGSASPSLETLMNVSKQKIKQLTLSQKARSSSPLSYHIIDLKKQPMNLGLSAELINAIRRHLAQQGQVLLFLNRRGYAPVLLCHECGWSSSCKRCDSHHTYHHSNQYLQCHHCGSSRRAPKACPQCQCEQMIPVGFGTERLEQSIEALFPQAKIARIDRDTTRKKSAMKDFVGAVKAGEIDILIGTQMLAKGHHFARVTLVALVDMDGALYSADFRAPELAAQLITQVSGRAGRDEKDGEVLIQTHHADHPMLQQIIHQGYAQFAESALAERIEAELPPHCFAAVFHAESTQLPQVQIFLNEVKRLLVAYQNLEVEILGPVPAVYTKKAGKFRYQIFLQSRSRNQLHQLLDLTLSDIEKLKSAQKVRWRVEVDPVGES